MKKIIAILSVLCLCIGLCSCTFTDYKKAQTAYNDGDYEAAYTLFTELGDYKDSADMAKKSAYKLGCEQMDDGEFSKAIATFEPLGDYEDCKSRIAECKVAEIDAILQGTWESGPDSILVTTATFNNGRFAISSKIGSSSIGNEGSYRIDLEEKAIYICYDYVISLEGKRPNTEEQVVYTYTYEDGVFELIDTLDVVYSHK